MGRPKGSKNKRVIIAQNIVSSTEKSENRAKLISKQSDNSVSQGFSVADLCRIISTASSCNVKSLRVNSIEVVFGDKVLEAEVPYVREDKTLRAKTLEHVERVKSDFDRAQLMFDDPMGFEAQEIEALSQGT